MENLTLDEKLSLLTGKDAWKTNDLNGKIQSVTMSDGPLGLRKLEPKTVYNEETGEKEQQLETVAATAFPSLSVIANSWNREAARLQGDGIADDCIEHDVDVILGPGVNIKRSPLCGRNFEYFSEDPYLAGELAYEYVDALESRGVGTSLKHFAANNGENYRHTQNSEMDERTFMELYAPAFERALKAKPSTVMCSYNLVNGVYASENKRLLSAVLRERFGFDGVIVSDWGAVKNRARALKATLDLEMPARYKGNEEIKAALAVGYINEEEIDLSAERVLSLAKTFTERRKTRKFTRDKNSRYKLAVKLAEEGIVLLKNNGILPLKKDTIIDLFNQEKVSTMAGGGSALVKTRSPIKNLLTALKEKGATINDHPCFGYQKEIKGCVPVLCVSTTVSDAESIDRRSIAIDKRHEEMILSVAKNYPNTIVVIYAGSAVDCSRFSDKVGAIIFAGYAGEGANQAVANILFGDVNPSGKLSETFPVRLEDCPSYSEFCDQTSDFYGERMFSGYRYFDQSDVKPLFPFGYGLSYSKFEYSNLKLEKISECEYRIYYDIKNISDVKGKEVSQVYVGDVVCSSKRPVKELKGFSKDEILPHQTKTVSLILDKRAFSYYNPSLKDYYVENGKFKIFVGASSVDVKLVGEIEINLPEYEQMSSYDCRNNDQWSL